MKEKIIYIHIGKSTFVQKDIEILSTIFDVQEFYFDIRKKHLLPFQFVKEFFFLIKNFKIKKSVSQFGGFHTILPGFFSRFSRKKKHVIILSGTDCVSFPSIHYGNFNRKFLAYATAYSLKSADLLLPVSQELVKYKYTYQDNDYPFQGYLYHAPKVKTKYIVIHYGYHPELWNAQHPKEENSFVTIAANLNSRFGVALKGIDLLIETATLLPHCQFYIVGGKTIHQDLHIPSNVYLMGNIPNRELQYFIGTKQYYLQLSMSEGFPNALCEAMMCECIPIVSNVSSMPFIVGETGKVLMKKDAHLLKTTICRALLESDKIEQGIKARNRIANEFSIKKRERKLAEAISNL